MMKKKKQGRKIQIKEGYFKYFYSHSNANYFKK